MSERRMQADSCKKHSFALLACGFSSRHGKALRVQCSVEKTKVVYRFSRIDNDILIYNLGNHVIGIILLFER